MKQRIIISFFLCFFHFAGFVHAVEKGPNSPFFASRENSLVNDPPVGVVDYDTTSEGISVPINVLANDYDPDGFLDPGSIFIFSPPSNGTLLINPLTGAISYTPFPGYLGSDFFTYTVDDLTGTPTQPTGVILTVLPGNSPPIGILDSVYVIEDIPHIFNPSLNDFDAENNIDSNSIVILFSPSHGSAYVIANTGSILYTPNANYTGPDYLEYEISDNSGAVSGSTSVIINVNPWNDKPVTNVDYYAGNEDNSLVLDVLINDYDPDGNLDFSSIAPFQLPHNGTITILGNGTIGYSPNSNFVGLDSFSYTVNDQLGDTSNPALVYIQVNPVNDPPLGQADIFNIEEDSILYFNPTLNDFDQENQLAPGSIMILSGSQNGTLQILDNLGNISFTPNPGYNGLDSFLYIIFDIQGLSSSPTIVILDILPINDPPIALPDTFSILEDVSLNADVLLNDIDSDGIINPSSISIIEDPVSGTVSMDFINGNLFYFPNPNFFGTDSFSYLMGDFSGGVSNVVWVHIEIASVNDPPFTTFDSTITVEDNPVYISLIQNDYDVDGYLDSMSVSLLSVPSNGTLGPGLVPGQLLYQPNSNFVGADSFLYSVSDNLGATSLPQLAVIEVIPFNDYPVGIIDFANCLEESSVSIFPISNDYDVDDGLDSASFSIETLPLNGSLIIDSINLMVEYFPDSNFFGGDSFSYSIFDIFGLSTGPVWVVIGVSNLPDAPVAQDDQFTIPEDSNSIIDVLGNDIDYDQATDISWLAFASSPIHGNLTIQSGNLFYQAPPNFIGADSFTYYLIDPQFLQSDTVVVHLLVTEVNDPPVANPDNHSTLEELSFSFNPVTNDTDPDGLVDFSSLDILSSSGNSTYVIDSLSGLVIYTPAVNFFGVDSLYYIIADLEGGISTPGLILITVDNINDPPITLDDTVEGIEDNTIILDPLINDYDTDGEIDSTSIIIGVLPAHGTILQNPQTGEWEYNPEFNYYGQDSFAYQVNDDLGHTSAPASVYISIVSVNDPPKPLPDSAEIPEDGNIEIFILENDDDDGEIDAGSVVIINSGSSDSISIFPNGDIEYFSSLNFYGIDTLVYQVCDMEGLCTSDSVFIMVSPLQDYPILENDDLSLLEDIADTLYVLINDVEPDGDSLIVSAVTQSPNHGNASFTSEGIVFNPDSNFYGFDTLAYVACDPLLQCDTAFVFIEIISQADFPLANPDNYLVDINSISNHLGLSINDVDVDGDLDSTSILLISPPVNGTLAINSGQVTYTPSFNYLGLDSFIYEICDLGGLCDTSLVTIEIQLVEIPPYAQNDTFQISSNSNGNLLNPLINDIDLNGNLDSTSLNLISFGNLSGTVNIQNNQLSYSPLPNVVGTDTLIYEICDSEGTCDTAYIFVQISTQNLPPIAIIDSFSLLEDAGQTQFIVTGNDLDPNGDLDPNTITIVSAPMLGALAFPSGPGKITYSPKSDFFGLDSLVYSVCDTSGLCGLGTVYFNVLPQDDPPIATNDTFSIFSGVFDIYSLLNNDIEIDGDSLLPALINPPSQGVFWITDNDSLEIMVSPEYEGVLVFLYEICDDIPTGYCDTAKITLTVTKDPRLVFATNDTITTTSSSLPEIDLLTNDIFSTTGSLELNLLIPPSHGTLEFTDPLEPSWSVPFGFVGIDSFQYEICNTDFPDNCDSAFVFIEHLLIDGLEIPNVFTPNSNGVNDEFIIKGIENYPDNQLRIFNIWGSPVYDVISYKNDWRGTNFSGKDLPSDTYYYLLHLGKNEKEIAGFIILYR